MTFCRFWGIEVLHQTPSLLQSSITMITDPLQTRPDFQSGSASPTKPGVYWLHMRRHTGPCWYTFVEPMANWSSGGRTKTNQLPSSTATGAAPFPSRLDPAVDRQSTIEQKYHHSPAPHLAVSSVSVPVQNTPPCEVPMPCIVPTTTVLVR